ncbi:MAG: cadherin-like domain-containing protein, partial [Anaerolineae bacterium]|nr:cadherin-like domain-containing protein [Anaerolineae bacterium]
MRITHAIARAASRRFGAPSSAPVTLLAVLLLTLSLPAPAAPVVGATKSDALQVDNDSDTNADPGDTLRYTIQIQNSGTTTANNVGLSDTIDANTTLSGVPHVSPLAFKDSYSSLGNVGITVPAASGLLLNDADPDNNVSLSVVAINGVPGNVGSATPTTAGGSVTVAGNGSFSYTPPAGFEGSDTFTYTLSDGDPLTPNDSDTVTIAVSDVIWFVDNSAICGTCDGRLGTPFNGLTGANGFSSAADDAGDVIFLYETGSGNYGGGIVLKDNQLLIGQGATPSIATLAGLTVPPFSNPLPATGGSRPVLDNANTAIRVAQNNTIRGLDIGNTTTTTSFEAGIAGTGAGDPFGTLTIDEMAIGGSGAAVYLQGPGALAVTLDNLSVTSSGNNGISIVGFGGPINGSFTVNGATTISNTTDGGIVVGATNSALFDFGSTNTSNNSGSGDAINLFHNPSGSFTFDSLSITNSSSGLSANNSGTITVNGSTNSIDVNGTGSMAVNLWETAIGSAGVTFQSVSANGNNRGIQLRNTGTGPFTITGTGTIDGSGGTLQNLTARAVSLQHAHNVTISNLNLINANLSEFTPAGPLSNCSSLSNGTGNIGGCTAPVFIEIASNISLNNLTINGSVQHGINGYNVNGLSISNTDLTNIGNNSLENGMHFINLLGTVSFDNVSVVGSNTRNVLIENDTGVLNMTVANSTFNTAGSEVGLDFLGLGTANITFSVTDSSFTDNNSVQLKALAEDNAVINATITGNDFDGNPAVTGNSGIDLVAVDGGTLTFDVIGTAGNPQTFQPFRSTAINIFASGGGTARGRVNGNTILGSALGAGIKATASVTDVNGFKP